MPRVLCFERRYGLVKVRVWCRRVKREQRYTVAVCRLFRNGDVWTESTRFGPGDLPVLKAALAAAYDWIYSQPRN